MFLFIDVFYNIDGYNYIKFRFFRSFCCIYHLIEVIFYE